MRRGYSPRKVYDDALAVLCWCQARVVHVPAAAVRAGQTASCGDRRCHAPKAA